MIPLRDSAPRHRLTPVNTALIAANLIVFAYEVQLGAGAGALLNEFGLVPARLAHLGIDAAGLAPRAVATLLTSLFLHAGLLHVAGNMLYLYIFGAAVEERLGAVRYLWFYLGAGVAAGLATIWMAPASHVPVVGASGAIAGVLGAYFIFHPRGRILTILPLFAFIEVPAALYLLLWFAVQLYGGLMAQAQAGMEGGVAWWAHVGGFLFGVAAGPMISLSRSPRRLR